MVTWRRVQMVLLSAQSMSVARIAQVAFTSEDSVGTHLVWAASRHATPAPGHISSAWWSGAAAYPGRSACAATGPARPVGGAGLSADWDHLMARHAVVRQQPACSASAETDRRWPALMLAR